MHHARMFALLMLLAALVAGCSAQPADYSSLSDINAQAEPSSDPYFQSEVAAADTPVLVDFSAEWCSWCQKLKPVLEQVEQTYAGRLKVVEVDVDQRAELAAHYGAQSLPTLILFRDGQVVDAVVGYLPEEELTAWLDESLQPQAVQ